MDIRHLTRRVHEEGLQLIQKSDRHWHVVGGIALLNVYFGKRGVTLYVQGTSKGRLVRKPDEVIAAAKQPTTSTPAPPRRRHANVRKRKWEAAEKRGRKPSCHWCGHVFASQQEATADHVLPRAKGGSNGDDNIVLACQSCNDKRADNVTAADVASIRKPPFITEPARTEEELLDDVFTEWGSSTE